jgi:tubby and related proteins
MYVLYDDGAQPNQSIDRSEWRVSMGCIEYETNFMGMKGPRKLKAILPRANNL